MRTLEASKLVASSERERGTFVFLALRYPTQHDLFYFHPFTCKVHDLIFPQHSLLFPFTRRQWQEWAKWGKLCSRDMRIKSKFVFLSKVTREQAWEEVQLLLWDDLGAGRDPGSTPALFSLTGWNIFLHKERTLVCQNPELDWPELGSHASFHTLRPMFSPQITERNLFSSVLKYGNLLYSHQKIRWYCLALKARNVSCLNTNQRNIHVFIYLVSAIVKAFAELWVGHREQWDTTWFVHRADFKSPK